MDSASSPVIGAFRATLDLFQTGVDLMRQNLRRRHPEAAEEPREQGLVMHTLRHANEIRSMEAIEELSDMPGTVKPEEVKLAKQVMGTFEGDVELREYRDDYRVGLREIIDARIEGREVVAAQEPRHDRREEEDRRRRAGGREEGTEKSMKKHRTAPTATLVWRLNPWPMI